MGVNYRVLFVCMGNICRSPAAECVFRAVLDRAGLTAQVQCDSAGTIDMHTGQAPDHRMQETGEMRGIAVRGRARQVTAADLEQFDLILTMDEENLADVRQLDVNGQYDEKIRLFCDFVEDKAEREVPDPYYGGQAGFDKVFDLLEAGAGQLLAYIRGRLPA